MGGLSGGVSLPFKVRVGALHAAFNMENSCLNDTRVDGQSRPLLTWSFP